MLCLCKCTVFSILVPGLGPRWGWSTLRSPLWCSYPGIGSSGKSLPAPAAAGWWSESSAVFVSFSWSHLHFHRHFSARQTSPFLGRIIMIFFIFDIFARDLEGVGNHDERESRFVYTRARQSINMQTCLIKTCLSNGTYLHTMLTAVLF